MKILQKKDTQVSKINRKIGRKQVLNSRDRQIGKSKEDPAVEDLSEEAKTQWKKLPQWKKQKLLMKLGDNSQRDGEVALQRDQEGDPAGQTVDTVQGLVDRPGSSGVRTPKEGAAIFLRENQKRGGSGLESLKRKWQITDEEAEEELDDHIEERNIHTDGESWKCQETPPAGFTAAGTGRYEQLAATDRGEQLTQREYWDTRVGKEDGSGRIRSGKRRLENLAGLRKRKNKLERLLSNSGGMLQRVEDLRITNSQDISEKADQTFERVKQSLDKK